MPENYFLKGLLMGIVFGVPAGAVGVLSVRNTLKGGFFSGLITGLGSSTADLFYAVVTVFGLTAVSDLLLRYQDVLGIAGGGMIIVLGVLNLGRGKAGGRAEGSTGNGRNGFIPAFLIAFMNPGTILSFFIAFAAFRIPGSLSLSEGVLMTGGILAGTVIWWAGLSGTVALFRSRVTEKINRYLNRVLGSLMILLGILLLFRIGSG